MGSKVVLALCVLAVALVCASGAEARKRKPHLGVVPGAHITKPHHSHGHRGGSSYGGASWSGSSYDHHHHHRH